MEPARFAHVPVLAAEVVRWLGPALAPGGVAVDCTLGAGGHARALLEVASEATVLGIDRDPAAVEAASRALGEFGSRARLVHGNYGELRRILDEQGVVETAAVLFDLGVSSPQLDFSERGFGIRSDRLDMRMDPKTGQSAEDVVNNYSEIELSRVISRYGQEKFARRVAAAIVRRRAERPFRDGADLAEVVKEAIPAATRRTGGHPARRTFQAIRIEVNRELEALEAALPQAIDSLRPGGRIAVISYHSLEDRIVKKAIAGYERGCICPRELPRCACGRAAQLRRLTAKSVRPGEQELRGNPRSDSARMRVAEKLESAA